jgi:hypothetical protein
MPGADRLAARFADLRETLFLNWDTDRHWQAVAGGGLTQTGYMGQCDSDAQAIRIRPDLVGLSDSQLDVLLVHEICHAITGEDEGSAWKSEMAKASRRAQEGGREPLAELITREIESYREGEYEVLDDDIVDCDFQDALFEHPNASFDKIADMVARKWNIPPELLLERHPNCRRAFEKVRKPVPGVPRSTRGTPLG